MRRFPPPWTVEQIPSTCGLSGFKVLDANGQSLAYVYKREAKADADIAKVLTMDEARRIAKLALHEFRKRTKGRYENDADNQNSRHRDHQSRF